MTLIDTIKAHRIAALKSAEKTKATFLGFLHAEIEKVGKNAGNRLTTEAEAIQALKKMAITARDTVALLIERGEEATTAAIKAEIALIESYLPEQMTEEQIRAEIEKLLEGLERTPKAIGTVMAGLKTKFDGLFDSKRASEIVRDILK